MKDFTIQRRCIFIISGGRTATRFLSELLAVSVKNCHSVQEPDIWRFNYFIDFNRNKNIFLQKIIDFGLYNMTLGKLLSLGSIRSLSIARQRGKIDKLEAAKRLYKLRHNYISRVKQDIYAEANLQLTGLIDIIPLVFPNSKTIFMIRDGRNWVRSYINIQFRRWANVIYSKSDPLYYLPYARLNAKMFPDDPFFYKWDKFSVFQRICWLWRSHIEYALKTIKFNPNANIIKYENFFEDSTKRESLNSFFEHLTKFPDNYQAEYQYNGELSGKLFHESTANRLSKWGNWPLSLVNDFQEICGDLLFQQGYGSEPEWKEMVTKAEKKKNNAE
jgi:hypothetical protein